MWKQWPGEDDNVGPGQSSEGMTTHVNYMTRVRLITWIVTKELPETVLRARHRRTLMKRVVGWNHDITKVVKSCFCLHRA